MDRLHELEVFVAVADAGSFAKAGMRLRLSPPAVTRAISGARRPPRRLRLQPHDPQPNDHGCRSALPGKRTAYPDRSRLRRTRSRRRNGGSERPSYAHGLGDVGRSALAPVVCAFLSQHPRVTMSVLLLDRIANLVEEGIDLAVRIGPLPDSNLVAKKIGTVRRILVASPDYLARRGVPQTPADLRHHSMVAFTGLMPNREWRFLDGKKGNSVSFVPRLEINDAAASIAAAEMGDGISVALSYMVAEQIGDGRLASILDNFTPPPVPVHLVILRAAWFPPN
jgi:DNA-binding transcriptional LysR family regulator